MMARGNEDHRRISVRYPGWEKSQGRVKGFLPRTEEPKKQIESLSRTEEIQPVQSLL
jgi:hypothetical protein